MAYVVSKIQRRVTLKDQQSCIVRMRIRKSSGPRRKSIIQINITRQLPFHAERIPGAYLLPGFATLAVILLLFKSMSRYWPLLSNLITVPDSPTGLSSRFRNICCVLSFKKKLVVISVYNVRMWYQNMFIDFTARSCKKWLKYVHKTARNTYQVSMWQILKCGSRSMT